ncbi:uncharacterized protein [Procambarus clarkii]|uniref:uncharacterized protein n=1 Tax=Procambarus clarkii TaxID=6728 RepID=UPI003744765D
MPRLLDYFPVETTTFQLADWLQQLVYWLRQLAMAAQRQRTVAERDAGLNDEWSSDTECDGVLLDVNMSNWSPSPPPSYPRVEGDGELLGEGQNAWVVACRPPWYRERQPLCVKYYKHGVPQFAWQEYDNMLALQAAGVPGVPRIVGQRTEPLGIVMTRHSNITLLDLLDTDLTRQQTLQVLLQVAATLDTMHDNDLVHNDLHSGNISVDLLPDGGAEAIVLDFEMMSIAGNTRLRNKFRSREREEQEATRARYYPWVAPELYLDGVGTPASDVYSFAYIATLLLGPEDRNLWTLQKALGPPTERPDMKVIKLSLEQRFLTLSP